MGSRLLETREGALNALGNLTPLTHKLSSKVGQSKMAGKTRRDEKKYGVGLRTFGGYFLKIGA